MWSLLKRSFLKTSAHIAQGVRALFQKADFSEADWIALEETLIMADMGTEYVQLLIQHAKKNAHTPADIPLVLSAHVAACMKPYEKKLLPTTAMVFVGVNGCGKTSTIGKLAALWSPYYNLNVVAGDTFRVSAHNQLRAWVPDLPFFQEGKDTATVVYKAIQQHTGYFLIDTAGRLPHKQDLMDELKKVYKVLQKQYEPKDITVILVLDSTSGQHTLMQAELFQGIIPISGVVMNKMDSTAKGGILLPLTQKYHIPIYGLGIGEKRSDYIAFEAEAYADALFQGAP